MTFVPMSTSIPHSNPSNDRFDRNIWEKEETMNRKVILVLGIIVLVLVPVLTGARGCRDYMDEGFTGFYDTTMYFGDDFEWCEVDLWQYEDGTVTGWYECLSYFIYDNDPPSISGHWEDDLVTFTAEGVFCEDFNPPDCWECSSLFHGSGTDLDGDGYYDTIEGSFRGTCPWGWYEAGTYVAERRWTPPK